MKERKQHNLCVLPLKTFGEFYTKNLPTKSSFPSAVFSSPDFFSDRGETSWGPDTLKTNRAKPYWNRSNRWGKLGVYTVAWMMVQKRLGFGGLLETWMNFLSCSWWCFFLCVFLLWCVVFIISGRGPWGIKFPQHVFFFPEGVWCKSKVLVFKMWSFFWLCNNKTDEEKTEISHLSP